MTSIFISYSRRDSAFAHRLAKDLRAAGHSVWWDVSGLRGGQGWAREIDRAVRGCEVFVLVVSPDAVDSEWVGKETILALDLRKPIVPVLWRETTLPVHLVDIQYVDFRASYDEGLQKLHQALTSPPIPAPRPSPPRVRPKRKRRSWLLTGSLVGCLLLVGVAAAGGIAWFIGSSGVTAPPVGVTAPPVVVRTAVPTSPISTLPPSDTPLPTPEPSATPVPTPNPGLGTFQTEFDEATEMVYLAFGPTLGGQAVCAYHNLKLNPQDVGKQLSVFIRNFDINAPDSYTYVLEMGLYRSLAGPWQAGQSIDMWESPQAEVVMVPEDKYELDWTVTQPGDYVICLQAEVNTYNDPEVWLKFASYTVLLRGG